jgi:hypothetical protein
MHEIYNVHGEYIYSIQCTHAYTMHVYIIYIRGKSTRYKSFVFDHEAVLDEVADIVTLLLFSRLIELVL